jgi:hypothetical protein
MNQLSLNVLALTIFGMTMSVLLAPLLHVSEGFVAVTIMSIVGFTTIDAFAWKGKAATIFLDRVARFSKAHRDRVIRHEAGHFLIAQQLGFEVTDYSLSAWEAFRKGNGGQGGIQFDASAVDRTMTQGGEAAAQMLDRLCTVWMAGIAAEQLEYGEVEGGEDDRFTMAQALIELKLPPSSITNKQRTATLQAKNLLKDNQAAYQALVSALESRATIGECCAAIGQATGV